MIVHLIIATFIYGGTKNYDYNPRFVYCKHIPHRSLFCCDLIEVIEVKLISANVL